VTFSEALYLLSRYQAANSKEIMVLCCKIKSKITPAELRDMVGPSRKYATALPEHMCEKKLTRCISDEKVLK